MEDLSLAPTSFGSPTLSLPKSSEQLHSALEKLMHDRTCSIAEKRSALSALRDSSGFPESINREVSATLLTTFFTNPEVRTEAIAVATHFIQNNRSSYEACRLAVALLGFKETPTTARDLLRVAVLERLSRHPEITEEASSELRGFCRLLIESVGVLEIQREAIASIHHILSERPRILNAHRTLLAREVLHLFRVQTIQQEHYEPLKDLASKLYILGAAHARTRVQSLSRINFSPAPCEENDEEKAARAARLLPALVSAGSTRQELRLSDDDWRAIATIQGLSQGEFKAVILAISRNALVDTSALSALLSLVKNAHDSSVTMDIRTSGLASLITDARRAGKLSHTLEQLVLATSAELPQIHRGTANFADPFEEVRIRE